MTHDEIEELLGAYALDAALPEQRQQIDAHIAGCSRCRAEIEAHLEMAAMLAGPGTEVPPGIWEKIARSITDQDGAERSQKPSPTLPPVIPWATVPAGRRPSRPRLWVAVTAVAAAVVILLGMEVAQLHSQIRSLNHRVAQSGLAEAALQAEGGPHRTVVLRSATAPAVATIVVTPRGATYWTGSSLPDLPSAQTYQLWGLSRGKPVSLGLVGPDPHAVGYFRLEADVSRVMVTVEPRGGTPLPTTAVLVQGAVPGRFVS